MLDDSYWSYASEFYYIPVAEIQITIEDYVIKARR